jgi:hypothetical protein
MAWNAMTATIACVCVTMAPSARLAISRRPFPSRNLQTRRSKRELKHSPARRHVLYLLLLRVHSISLPRLKYLRTI